MNVQLFARNTFVFKSSSITFQAAVRKIQESVTNYSSYNLVNAKLAYIKAWQALPEFGLTHFMVKFRQSRKEVGLCVLPAVPSTHGEAVARVLYFHILSPL